MRPHKACVKESMKRCHCINDYVNDLPTKGELDDILWGFGVSNVLGQRHKLLKALDKRING